MSVATAATASTPSANTQHARHHHYASVMGPMLPTMHMHNPVPLSALSSSPYNACALPSSSSNLNLTSMYHYPRATHTQSNRPPRFHQHHPRPYRRPVGVEFDDDESDNDDYNDDNDKDDDELNQHANYNHSDRDNSSHMHALRAQLRRLEAEKQRIERRMRALRRAGTRPGAGGDVTAVDGFRERPQRRAFDNGQESRNRTLFGDVNNDSDHTNVDAEEEEEEEDDDDDDDFGRAYPYQRTATKLPLPSVKRSKPIPIPIPLPSSHRCPPPSFPMSTSMRQPQDVMMMLPTSPTSDISPANVNASFFHRHHRRQQAMQQRVVRPGRPDDGDARRRAGGDFDETLFY